MSSTKFVFYGPIRKTRWLPGLWLAETVSTSPLKPLNGIQWNLTGSKISMSSNKFVFYGSIGITRWPPGVWLAETFLTSLEPLNRIQWNLAGSKISTSSTKFVFCGPIEKSRWSSLPLIGWDIFDFSSETAVWNSTNLTGSKISCTQVHVMWPLGPLVYETLSLLFEKLWQKLKFFKSMSKVKVKFIG